MGALGTLVLASCSLIVDSHVSQCATTADCVGRGAAFSGAVCVDTRCVSPPPIADLADAGGGADTGRASETDATVDAALDPWRCVGKVRTGPATQEPIVEHATFTSFLDQRPIPGLTARLCARADVDCESPLATVVSDAEGRADIPLTKGFLGFLEMKTAPVSLPGLMPMILPYSPPPFADLTSTKGVATTRDLGALAAAVGATVDTTRGMVFLTLQDCDGQAASGLQAELAQHDDKVSLYYLVGWLPSVTTTSTDDSGTMVIANVRPGLVTVNAKDASSGRKLGSQNVLARAGTITVVAMPPTPL